MAKLRENITDSEQPKQRDKRTRKRIIVYQNDDGTPILSDLTDEQRGQLGLNGTGGSAGTSAAPAPETDQAAPVEPIPPHVAGMMLNLMVSIEAAIVAPKIGIAQHQAQKALTPAPPLADAIVDAGTRVLNKYAAPLGKWADEMALCALLVTWQSSAFAEMRAIVAAMKPAEPAPPPPDKHYTTEPKPADAPPPRKARATVTEWPAAPGQPFAPGSSDPNPSTAGPVTLDGFAPNESEAFL